MSSFFQTGSPPIVLASASAARARILGAAGIDFSTRPARVDEAAVKQALRGNTGEVAAADVAEILARTKAVTVSEAEPAALVIGADQTLSCDGRLFDKPRDADEARDQLLALRGRDHALHTAVACARNGEIVWHHVADVRMAMRDFSNEFLGRYLAASGDELTATVGGYRLEGPGVQLFSCVEGDYFTVLGLPLLPLLDFLRSSRILVA